MQTRIQNSSPRRVVSFLFFLPFTLLVVLTALLFALSSQLRTSEVSVAHALEVKNAIGYLLNHLLEAESAARGFLLTGNVAFLDDQEVAGRARTDLQRVQRLTVDNPAQQQSVAALEPLVHTRLEFLAQLVSSQKQNLGDQAHRIMDQGKRKMDAIRPMLLKMQKEEDRLLNLREARAEAESRFTRVLAAILLLADLAVMIVIVSLLRRAQRLQQLVTVCAWTKTIQHEGHWLSFEEYLQQRFGISVTHSISRAAYNKLQSDVDAQEVCAA